MRPAAPLLAVLCALGLGACGDTLQEHPIPHNVLEGLLVSPYPVYWLGASFHGLAVSEATHDPGGAYTVQYGDCLEAGQGACVPPLRVVSSPDNSFLPGAPAAAGARVIRGASALIAQGGRTIVVPTGNVVVDIYANRAGLARAAAETMVPINEVGWPEAPLPPRLPDSGFAATPRPSQVLSPPQPLP